MDDHLLTGGEPLPLSYLSQVRYCPRRAALILLDQAWADNEYTASGASGHEVAHAGGIERRDDSVRICDFRVHSDKLGLSGRCDLVEAISDPAGVHLPFLKGAWRLYPVEYKHGKVRDEEEYNLQLCAQAMSLEEAYGGSIPEGAVFYLTAHRRKPVALTEGLRREVEVCAARLWQLMESKKLPPPIDGPKCLKCSLNEVCQPRLSRSARAFNARTARDACGEEAPP